MRISERIIITSVVILMALSLMASPASAKTWKVTMAAGHAPIFLFVSAIRDFFIPYVNEKLAPMGHKIIWQESYGGTVCKVAGCLEALDVGIVEMANVCTIFEAAKMPLHNVTYFTPFGTSDASIVLDTVIELRETIPAVKDEWTKHNSVCLGGAAMDTYNLYSKTPVKSVDDIKGHKVGTGGPIALWVKGTGAVGVATSLPEVYNSMQLGVYEDEIIFNTAALAIKLYEVAPNLTEVNFGAQYATGLAVNKKFFDKLPPEVQQVLRDAGKFYTKKHLEAQSAKAVAAKALLKKAGTNIIPFSDKERAKWANMMPNIPMEWAAQMKAKGLPGKQVVQGYLDGLRKRGVKLVRDWDRE